MYPYWKCFQFSGLHDDWQKIELHCPGVAYYERLSPDMKNFALDYILRKVNVKYNQSEFFLIDLEVLRQKYPDKVLCLDYNGNKVW